MRVGSAGDEGAINVQTEDGPMPFEQKSVLFDSINKNYERALVRVYAPVSWDNPAEPYRKREKLRDPITSVIKGICK